MKKKYRLKYTFIKKYEVDLWGYLISCPNEKPFFKKIFKIICFKNKRKSKIINFFFKKYFRKFIYSKNIVKWKKRRVFNKDYIVYLRTLVLFRTYYGDFTIKKFKNFIKRIDTTKLDFISKCLLLFESRLDILMYRLNYFKNPRESRNFIRNKNIKINNKIIKVLNYQLYINDIIDVKLKYKLFFHNKIYKKTKKKRVLFNFPKYLESNYKLLKTIFMLYPKKKTNSSYYKI